MSAHLRPLKVACDRAGCKSRALVEVFNAVNASLGTFCRKHGAELVRVLNAQDREREDSVR